MYFRFCAAAAILLFATGSSYAEQLNWDGTYIGANVGGNVFATDFDSNSGTLVSHEYHDGAVSIGGMIGYGRVLGRFYVGGELEAQAFKDAVNRDAVIIGHLDHVVSGAISGSAGGPCVGSCGGGVPGSVIGGASGVLIGGPAAAGIVTETGDRLEAFETEINAMFSARARVGMPVGRFLPYVTAGLAVGKTKTGYLRLDEVNIRNPDGTLTTTVRGGVAQHDELAIGYSIGAGTEIALTSHLSLRAEYIFSDLGGVRFEVPENSVEASISSRAHQFRLGVALRF